MALSDERLPTYRVADMGLLTEAQVHAMRRYVQSGTEQVLTNPDGLLLDIIGCEHRFVTKRYGHSVTCDRCCRFRDDDGEWKVVRRRKVTQRVDADTPID